MPYFKPVIEMPCTNCFWAMINTTSTGMVIMAAAAINWFHCVM